jgi:hypothetical protein
VAAPITTLLIAGQAEQLGRGGLRFTARQLYYASCAAAERPPRSATPSLLGCSALLVLLSALLVRISHPPVSLVLAPLGAAGLLFALVNARLERRRARERALDSRPLAESYDGFCAGPLARAVSESGEALAQLIAATVPPAVAAGASPPATGDPAPPAASPGRGPLLVCDRTETALLLRANLDRLPEGAEVVDASTGDLGGVAANPARRVVLIHDADPAGCGLAARVRAAGTVMAVDAGLRPPASDAGLPVIEGAPARLPEGAEVDLSVDELGWLRSGRRLELASLAPQAVVDLVAAATGASDSLGYAARP